MKIVLSLSPPSQRSLELSDPGTFGRSQGEKETTLGEAAVFALVWRRIGAAKKIAAETAAANSVTWLHIFLVFRSIIG